MNHDLSIASLLLAAAGPLFFFLLPGLRKLPAARFLTVLPALLTLLVNPSFSFQVPLLTSQITLGFGTSGKWILGCTVFLWLVVLATTDQQQFKLDHIFAGSFLLTLASSLANVVTQNLLGFYLFFTLMGYACYGVLIRVCGERVPRAAKVYLILQVSGDLILFELCLALAAKIGAPEFTALSAVIVDMESDGPLLGLALVGVMAKAGFWPLHFWLPMVFRFAPVTIMILLGIILPSAGMVGWFNLFPGIEIVTSEWPDRMQMMGLAGLFYSVVVGLTQKHPGSILAYMLIALASQLTMVFGNFLGRPVGVDYPTLLLIFPIIHYALSGTALILSLGVAAPIRSRSARFWVWFIPIYVCLTGAGFIVIMISILGGSRITGLELCSVAALTLLMVRFGYLIQTCPVIKSANPDRVLVLLQAGVVLASLTSLIYWINALTRLGLAFPELGLTVAAMLAGFFVALSVWKLRKRLKIMNGLLIPPGDIVVPLAYLGGTLLQQGLNFGENTLPALKAQFQSLISFPWKGNQLFATLKWGEKNLQYWRTAMILMVLLGLVLMLTVPHP